MEYFTSDWHIGHKNIISLSDRPFKTIDEMTETIFVENVLKKVKAGDTIYYLGDLTFSHELAFWMLRTLHERRVKFYWILGNHDFKLPLSQLKMYCEGIVEALIIKRDKIKIHMNHFPLMIWEGSFRNFYHLYGHVHRNSIEYPEIEERMLGKTLNVNVEFNDFQMWTLKEIQDYMEWRPSNWDYKLKNEKKRRSNLSIF